MLAIEDFGMPSRRASSLGPAGSPAASARTSRMRAARVTAGASESAVDRCERSSSRDRVATRAITSF